MSGSSCPEKGCTTMTDAQPEIVEEKTRFGEYDTDAAPDAVPDYDAELTEEPDETFEEED